MAQVTLLDADLSNRYNVEQLMWKSAFYHVIEAMRSHSNTQGHHGNGSTEGSNNKEMTENLHQLLNEVRDGVSSYNNCSIYMCQEI